MAGRISDWLGEFDFFGDLIDPLVSNGWFDFFFPFLLVYAIIITILNNVEIFENKKPIRVVIAIIIGITAIAFPITENSCPDFTGQSSITSGCTLGDFMIALFPGITAFSIGILALYIVAATMGLDLMDFFKGNSNKNNIIKYVLGILGILVVAYYYAKGFGWDGLDGSGIEEFLTDPLLYILIVGFFVFYFITKDEGEGDVLEAKIRQRTQEILNEDGNTDTRSQARAKARKEKGA